ncbi:hypothetical protein [Candidatus Enterovibrio altilux]|uniref:Uncharacterized protein n=1 Tax=Candidatus Enterovibrio altilux TaxID=1927128 RepID=A0A291B991_9GAMM|nr:hypothetical protein [Candidatus Enterovibrio luxaltus]ATF09551.1 hypothetical protein BTN50_1049 [Candidatus Enterovibrio luxaltus]
MKKGVNPSLINEAWAKINQRVSAVVNVAELCGKDYGFMSMVVITKPVEECNA